MSTDIYDLVLMLAVGWVGGVVCCIVIADLGVYLRKRSANRKRGRS